MAMYPEVLRKAQAEIDTVVGVNRLPDFNDRPHLPYVNAIIKETMRWKMVLPIGKRFFNVLLQLFIMAGFAHMAIEDDEYDGCFIPKGTAVIGASWYVFRRRVKTSFHTKVVYRSILHDPEVFEAPEEFKPERYLKNGQIDPGVRDPVVAAFGYGRR